MIWSRFDIAALILTNERPRDVSLSCHSIIFFFDDRGQGRELNEAEQAGKVSFTDFYDNGRHIFISFKIKSVYCILSCQIQFVSLFLVLFLYYIILFYVSSFFLNSPSLFSLVSISPPSPSISPHQMDQLLGSVIEMWVDRMDNITQPERRKLSSLALLSLLPSDNR